MGRTLTKKDLFHYFYEENLGPYLAFQRTVKVKPTLAKRIVAKLIHASKGKNKSLRILDVGCAGGEMMRCYVDRLISFSPELQIRLVAADPAGPVLDVARKNLEGLSPNVSIDFQQVGVYPQPGLKLCDTLDGEEFDFILVAFVMFWIDDWDDAIDQLLECLTPEGLLCIIQLSREHGKEYAEFRSRIYEVAHQETGYRMEFAEDLERILKDRGLDYEAEVVCSSDLALSPNHANKVTEDMEFIMRFPRKELTPYQLEAIKEHTRAVLCSEPLECCRKLIWVQKQ